MQASRKIFVHAVVFWLLLGPAFCGPLEDALDAIGKGDYAAALQLLRPLAEQGDVRAQFNLAVMYAEGEGVPRDYKQAAMWYRKAAEQGDANAQTLLGAMYADGKGVTQDYVQALGWFRKAAGQGVPKAQFILGLMYRDGTGAPEDYVQAHLWLNLAAARFPAAQEDDRNAARQVRDRVAKKMTPEQIAEAERLAREWKPQGR